MTSRKPWAFYLSLTAILGALSLSAAWGQEAGIDDGKARCHPWLQYLREHPTELVKFTGKDEFGQKVKLLADKRGGYWRLALMAGAEDSMFGCFILEGTSWIGPDD